MKLDPKYDDYSYPYEGKNPPEGHAGNLSEIQVAQTEQLRMMLEAEDYKKRLDTLTLLRFLRARKWDVMQAKAMFVACEDWRMKVKLDDTVPTWKFPVEIIFPFYPQFYHKTDKDGRPVYYEQLGGIDLNKMAEAVYEWDPTLEENQPPTLENKKKKLSKLLLTNLAVEYERFASPRLEACSRKASHLVDTCTSIIDVSGVSVYNAKQVYDHVREAAKISNDGYPERLGKLYVINAPWTFTMIWSMVKNLIDPVSVQKIEILNTSYIDTLQKQIPLENLPKEFGGTCECPGGCMYSDAGPWKDPQYTQPSWWEIEAEKVAAAKESGISKEGNDAKAIDPKATEAEAPEGVAAAAPAAA